MTWDSCNEIVDAEISFYRDMIKLLSALVVMVGGAPALADLNLENPQ